MKLSLCALALGTVAAQGAQFFRISGPVKTTITALSADGHITWSNSPTNAIFIVQTAQSLLSPTNWVDYIQVPVTNAVTTERIYDPNPPSGMALIPAGSFTMGDTLDAAESDAIPTNVYVSAFYMDTTLVQFSQWQGVFNWATNNGYGFDYAGSGKAANHPVQTVDWYDTVKWCNARSQQAGLTPVYYTDAGLAQVYTNGDELLPYVNWSASGYRLPTEAEWEKAARGGLSGQRFPWGNSITVNLAAYNSTSYYQYDLGPYNGCNTNWNGSVGYFAANGYGLYDMAGNVLERCWDWYGTPYGQPSTTNPTGPASSPILCRVLRGGSWIFDAYMAQCATRAALNPMQAAYNWDDIGFRCVRGF